VHVLQGKSIYITMPFDDEDVNGCDHTGSSSSGLEDARAHEASTVLIKVKIR
jgi:hypothetical protein